MVRRNEGEWRGVWKGEGREKGDMSESQGGVHRDQISLDSLFNFLEILVSSHRIHKEYRIISRGIEDQRSCFAR